MSPCPLGLKTDMALSVFAPWRRLTTDAVLLRFRAEGCRLEPIGSKAALQKFARRCRAASHTLLVPKIVHKREFLARQNDLHSLNAAIISFSHSVCPSHHSTQYHSLFS